MTTDELINRIDVYEDTQEVVDGLREEANYFESKTGEYPYYAKESAIHIEGLWELVQDLKSKLETK